MDVSVDNLMQVFETPFPIDAEWVVNHLHRREGHGIVRPEDKWKKRQVFPE
jgi:hypothetical protein